jgi:hypothetical protein
MLLQLPAMTVNIEWQDQHGRWHHLQSKQNQTDAYRVAMRRAESTGKRHRLVDSSGRLLEQREDQGLKSDSLLVGRLRQQEAGFVPSRWSLVELLVT